MTQVVHNFIDPQIAQQAGYSVDPKVHMLVGITNGDKTVSIGICANLPWSMQSHDSHPIRLLPSGGCNMVLGVDWLHTLGNILFNFEQMNMSFHWEGKFITLRGHKDNAIVRLLYDTSLWKFLRKNHIAYWAVSSLYQHHL